MRNIKYLIVGMLFGIVLVKSQVVSWFRIQEMFRLQAFHMYGVIGSAIVVGMISVLLIKRFQIKTINHEAVVIPDKNFTGATFTADSSSASAGQLPVPAPVHYSPKLAAAF
jgi:hypothetical protein